MGIFFILFSLKKKTRRSGDYIKFVDRSRGGYQAKRRRVGEKYCRVGFCVDQVGIALKRAKCGTIALVIQSNKGENEYES